MVSDYKLHEKTLKSNISSKFVDFEKNTLVPKFFWLFLIFLIL